jgi:predicted alpha/beta superfamily hydrolase
MNKLLLFILINFSSLFAQEIKVSSGKIQRFENFKSQFVDARNIDVWLPDNYSADEKYAVLYMNDGQMLFDATTTWNKQAWEVDETAGKLNSENKTKKFIVVGIWNNGSKRHPEYFPQKPFESLTQTERDTITKQLQKAGRTKDEFHPYSDLYLKFLVKELKPFIDKNFSTKKDKNNTFIAGSSMGGLISMYAMCEYPKVFGGAACLSTHWPGTFTAENNPIPEAFRLYLKSKLSKIKKNKIYFDYGDQTLDALYPPLQQKVDEMMRANGFSSNNWMTQFFPGKDHSEKSWNERLPIPLAFLLKN